MYSTRTERNRGAALCNVASGVEVFSAGAELRPEYELAQLKGGVRGKYLQRYRSGTNLVLLSPDVAEHFPDTQSVKSALRTLIRAAKLPVRGSR
jgi:hypothetical protein